MKNTIWDYTIEPIYYDVHLDKNVFQLNVDTNEKWLMFMVEEGSFHYKINNSSGIANPGNIVICPPHTKFHRKAISPLILHFMQCSWSFIGDDQEFGNVEALFPNYMLSFSDQKEIVSLLREVRHMPNQTNDDLWRKHLINHIWYKYGVDQSTVENEKKKINPYIHQIKLYIDTNAFDLVSLSTVAEQFNLSPVQLTRDFKSAYGITPIKYLLNLRMERSKQLLINTNDTIHQIALKCGYENGFYFSRVFSKNIGVAPSKYRSLNFI